jgi:hypothetical protein
MSISSQNSSSPLGSNKPGQGSLKYNPEKYSPNLTSRLGETLTSLNTGRLVCNSDNEDKLKDRIKQIMNCMSKLVDHIKTEINAKPLSDEEKSSYLKTLLLSGYSLVVRANFVGPHSSTSHPKEDMAIRKELNIKIFLYSAALFEGHLKNINGEFTKNNELPVEFSSLTKSVLAAQFAGNDGVKNSLKNNWVWDNSAEITFKSVIDQFNNPSKNTGLETNFFTNEKFLPSMREALSRGVDVGGVGQQLDNDTEAKIEGFEDELAQVRAELDVEKKARVKFVADADAVQLQLQQKQKQEQKLKQRIKELEEALAKSVAASDDSAHKQSLVQAAADAAAAQKQLLVDEIKRLRAELNKAAEDLDLQFRDSSDLIDKQDNKLTELAAMLRELSFEKEAADKKVQELEKQLLAQAAAQQQELVAEQQQNQALAQAAIAQQQLQQQEFARLTDEKNADLDALKQQFQQVQQQQALAQVAVAAEQQQNQALAKENAVSQQQLQQKQDLAQAAVATAAAQQQQLVAEQQQKQALANASSAAQQQLQQQQLQQQQEFARLTDEKNAELADLKQKFQQVQQQQALAQVASATAAGAAQQQLQEKEEALSVLQTQLQQQQEENQKFENNLAAFSNVIEGYEQQKLETDQNIIKLEDSIEELLAAAQQQKQALANANSDAQQQLQQQKQALAEVVAAQNALKEKEALLVALQEQNKQLEKELKHLQEKDSVLTPAQAISPAEKKSRGDKKENNYTVNELLRKISLQDKKIHQKNQTLDLLTRSNDEAQAKIKELVRKHHDETLNLRKQIVELLGKRGVNP